PLHDRPRLHLRDADERHGDQARCDRASEHRALMDSTPPSEPVDRTLTIFSAVIWTVVAMMLNILCISLTESGREGAIIDPVSRTGFLVLADSVVLCGLLRF